MFTTGQTVLYGANGVCRIAEITTRRIGKDEIEYYVLKPMGAQTSTVYVPTHNEMLVGRMRPVSSAEEIRTLLATCDGLSWRPDNSERSECFCEILSRGDCGELIAMVRLLRSRQHELLATGKHLHLTDERQLREAEKMAGEEVAFALGVDVPQAIGLIISGQTA